jgi:hypothetical protein
MDGAEAGWIVAAPFHAALWTWLWLRAGQDNSKDFHGPQHTGGRAEDTIEDFLIGVLAGTKEAAEGTPSQRTIWCVSCHLSASSCCTAHV